MNQEIVIWINNISKKSNVEETWAPYCKHNVNVFVSRQTSPKHSPFPSTKLRHDLLLFKCRAVKVTHCVCLLTRGNERGRQEPLCPFLNGHYCDGQRSLSHTHSRAQAHGQWKSSETLDLWPLINALRSARSTQWAFVYNPELARYRGLLTVS